MAKLMQVRKHVEEYPGEADGGGSLYVGACFREPVPGERAETVGGFVRIWEGGLGGRRQFELREAAMVWKAVPLECWVEQIEPDENGMARYRTVVRTPDALFEVLTDGELVALADVLYAELDRDERRETLWDGALRRMLRVAEQENTARAMRAKKLALEHGVMP